MTVFVALVVLLLGALGYFAARELRHQRHAYRLLCRKVEAAAAPGEPVLVSSWIVGSVLHQMGSPALREQLVGVHRKNFPAAELSGGEFLLLVAPDDPLLQDLRDRGFSIAPEVVDPRGGDFLRLAGVKMFFAVGPSRSH